MDSLLFPSQEHIQLQITLLIGEQAIADVVYVVRNYAPIK